MNASDAIQIGILLVGLVSVTMYLRRDNRLSNKETFEEQINQLRDYMNLKNEIDQVNQKIEFIEKAEAQSLCEMDKKFEDTKKDFDEIKHTLSDIYDRINQHIQEHAKRKYDD